MAPLVRCARLGFSCATRSSQKAPEARASGTGRVPFAIARSALAVHAAEKRVFVTAGGGAGDNGAGGDGASSSRSESESDAAMTARRSRARRTTSGSSEHLRICVRTFRSAPYAARPRSPPFEPNTRASFLSAAARRASFSRSRSRAFIAGARARAK